MEVIRKSKKAFIRLKHLIWTLERRDTQTDRHEDTQTL